MIDFFRTRAGFHTIFRPHAVVPLLAVLASPVSAALYFENAVVLVSATAEASAPFTPGSSASMTRTDSAGQRVDAAQFVSANVPSAGAASVGVAGNIQFEGSSSFVGNVSMELTTAKLPGEDGAYSFCRFTVRFRVDGQSVTRPVWRRISSSITSNTLQHATLGPVWDPSSVQVISDDGTNMTGAVIPPGSYRVEVRYNFHQSWSGDGGTTNANVSGRLDFGTPGSSSPGFSQGNPILPAPAPQPPPAWPIYDFVDGPTNRWYDPPAAHGFTFRTTDGSKFTDILNFPEGFGDQLNVVVNGQSAGTFGPDKKFSFESLAAGGVSEFHITGIRPFVDPFNPAAFPVMLRFSASTADFQMIPLRAPEIECLPLANGDLRVDFFGVLQSNTALTGSPWADLNPQPVSPLIIPKASLTPPRTFFRARLP